MPFFIVSIILQVCLVLHVVKTGRNTTWIWIVVMLPFAGAIGYLVVEVLPEFFGTRTGRRASRKIRELANPNRDLNEAIRNYDISDSVENAVRLAEEYLIKGMFAESKALFERSLVGLHDADPHIMFGLAKAEFGLAKYQACKDTLDKLIRLNPEFRNQEAHLLYAKSLESLGAFDEAFHEYETLSKYYAGPEAKYRFAVMCKKQGQMELANRLLSEILFLAKASGKHYNILHKEWIKLAKLETASDKNG